MDLSEFIPRRLEELEMTKHEFGRRLGYTSGGLIHNIIDKKSDKRVPLRGKASVDKWVRILKLEGELERSFRDAVDESHAPPGILSRVKRNEVALEAVIAFTRRILLRVFPMATDEQIENLVKSLGDPNLQRDAWNALTAVNQPRTIAG